MAGHEHVIGCDVPLAATPDIAAIRKTLLFEFPYATETIDRLLADLVGRPFVHLTPTILVGPPGCGEEPAFSSPRRTARRRFLVYGREHRGWRRLRRIGSSLV